jgi:hypothetical protein
MVPVPVIGNMTTEIRLRMMAFSLRVERAVRRDFGVQWWRPSAEDELRLLRLEQFEQKYKVTLEWILKLLVPVWKQKFGKFKKGQGLGVAISTLTGNVSERIIRDQIKRDFPDGENIQTWKAQEQQRQWLQVEEVGNVREDWEHPAQTIKRYRRRMGAQREELRRFSQSQRKRNYRNNPWI